MISAQTHRVRLRALLSLLAALAFAVPAAAEQDSAGEARQRFLRGVELFDAGDHSAALAEFMWAFNLRPHFAIHYNIAQCYASMNRYEEAIERFQTYLEEGGRQVPRGRRRSVEQEIERLQSLLALVEVTVDVEGARIFVDGEEVGAAPLDAPLRVRAGLRIVEARLDGYRNARVEVTVAGGATAPPVELHLEPLHLTGLLRVESPAPGARVFVDQRERGGVPWQGELSAGEHVVEVRAERYRPARREIVVTPNEERSIEVELDPVGRPARLHVVTEVAGARVFAEEREAGVTPLRPLDLPAGVYRIRVEREGFAPWEGNVTLREAQSTTATVDLAPLDWGVHQAWFWTMLSLSAAAGIAAGVTGYLTMSESEDLDSFLEGVEEGTITGARDELEGQRADMRETGQTLALTTDILLIGTAAAAVTTLVLGFFTRFGPPESRVDLDVGASLAPGQASLSASGRF